MTSSAAASRIVLVADPENSCCTPAEAPRLRRFRLARLHVNDRSAEERFAYLRRAYD